MANYCYSQEGPGRDVSSPTDNISLEELLNTKISVASVKELTARESPGVISFITEEDILASGARSLMDVLSLIPGFEPAMDVEGVAGIGMRGGWAHEGKLLLLVDGIERNENLYSTMQADNYVPIESIKRVEIIRGPGSVIYGGTAAYGVINIVTKKPQETAGFACGVMYAHTGKQESTRGLSFHAGENLRGVGYTLSGGFKNSIRSDRNYSDVFGNTYSLSNQSGIGNAGVNLGLYYRDYQLKVLADRLTIHTRDGYQEILTEAYPMKFENISAEIKKLWRINDRLSVNPRAYCLSQYPWSFDRTSVHDEFPTFRIHSVRVGGGVVSDYDINNRLNLISGIEYFNDAAYESSEGEPFKWNNSRSLAFGNYAFYSQVLFYRKGLSGSFGARYNYNSGFGASFVPRFGIAYVASHVHIKALYSRSFRSPSIMNMDAGINLRPETSSVVELETGYAFTDRIYASANFYHQKTFDPIVYAFDDVLQQDSYKNADRSGTRGAEAELWFKTRSAQLKAGYSFYIPLTDGLLADYSVPFHQHSLLAFPSHKATCSVNFSISRSSSIYCSAIYKSSRFGITSVSDVAMDPFYKKFNAGIYFNAGVTQRLLLDKNLSVGFYIHNITNQEDWLIQPYNSLHAPVPYNNRELVLKISYSVPFKKN